MEETKKEKYRAWPLLLGGGLAVIAAMSGGIYALWSDSVNLAGFGGNSNTSITSGALSITANPQGAAGSYQWWDTKPVAPSAEETAAGGRLIAGADLGTYLLVPGDVIETKAVAAAETKGLASVALKGSNAKATLKVTGLTNAQGDPLAGGELAKFVNVEILSGTTVLAPDQEFTVYSADFKGVKETGAKALQLPADGTLDFNVRITWPEGKPASGTTGQGLSLNLGAADETSGVILELTQVR